VTRLSSRRWDEEKVGRKKTEERGGDAPAPTLLPLWPPPSQPGYYVVVPAAVRPFWQENYDHDSSGNVHFLLGSVIYENSEVHGLISKKGHFQPLRTLT